MKIAPAAVLSDEERRTLAKRSHGRSTPARLVLRAKIVLAAAEGKMNETIAAELGTSNQRTLAQSVCAIAIGGDCERRLALAASLRCRRRSSRDFAEDHAGETRQRHPLEHTIDGESRWREQGRGLAHGIPSRADGLVGVPCQVIAPRSPRSPV